jgi:tRNA/tmRNA/rRNA uracil-C5-methylase (TrmA/RlmC/RlmD family)
VGRRFEVECGPIAHGGHVVARVPADVPGIGGVVVFVRHALPGERVMVAITEGAVGDRFLRGDAVAVSGTSSDRVTPPCPHAGPGKCGGCDLQHVAPHRQRVWKAQVVQEQLRRIAGIDREVTVQPLRDPEDGLRWRRRMRYHRLPDGRLGLRRHRSHDLEPVADCLVQAPDAIVVVEGEPLDSPTVVEHVGPHAFEVRADGFWQAHRDAPEVFGAAVLELGAIRSGDRVVDLYAGVGVLSAPLAAAVGEAGEVLAVEGDREAARLAAANLAGYPWARVVGAPVAGALGSEVGAGRTYDVVVLDPPRVGARRDVVERIVALSPRTVVHVACDPAAFARDAGLLAEHGYTLTELQAFDAYPMTHHVEVVGRFDRDPEDDPVAG